jgi:hypothetical protein
MTIVIGMARFYNCNQSAIVYFMGEGVAMRRKTRGQSLVEMAFILPLLLLIIFGIIDFGYYIYSYATVYQAARNAAEVAAGAPPYPGRISADHDDPKDLHADADTCVRQILAAAQDGAVLFEDLEDHVTIVYPEYQLDPRNGQPIPADDRRKIGYPIEIGIKYEVEPLTPLWKLVPIGDEGVIEISTVSRRSIEAYGRDPSSPGLSACEPVTP